MVELELVVVTPKIWEDMAEEMVAMVVVTAVDMGQEIMEEAMMGAMVRVPALISVLEVVMAEALVM
jgi:hypothetical protein